jgi:hypothetical protein
MSTKDVDFKLELRGKHEAWVCPECGGIAEEERNNEECTKCSNGWNCGRDCTLSKLICKKCKRSKAL